MGVDSNAEREVNSKIRVLSEGKLGERVSWDEWFMLQAILVSRRSSCHKVHAGTILATTDTHYILGTGYNGAPPGIKSCLDLGYCVKEKRTGEQYGISHGTGNCQGTHSEINALAHLSRVGGERFTAYVTIYPCHDCTKGLIAYPLLERVVFKSLYSPSEVANSLSMFQERRVEVCRLDLTPKRAADILFNESPAKFTVWSPQDREAISSFKI